MMILFITAGGIEQTEKLQLQEWEKDMAELATMMNIGKEMAKKLDSVGIGSAEELVCSGAEQAFLKLKARYPNVCLVHLYALEGAVRNVEFNSLPESRKKELKEFSDFLRDKPYNEKNC